VDAGTGRIAAAVLTTNDVDAGGRDRTDAT
jgi:hypothetical protein